MLVRPGFEPTASCSADRRLSHWANRAAVMKCIEMEWTCSRMKVILVWYHVHSLLLLCGDSNDATCRCNLYSSKRSERWLWHFLLFTAGWEKCSRLDYYLSHVIISCQQALRVLHLVKESIILIYWFFTSFYRARQMSGSWGPSRVSWRCRKLLCWW